MAPAVSDSHQPRLRRELGLLSATGLGLGAVMGAGIFVVIGVAAGVAGPAFLVGLGLAGAVAACNGLSSAQLAARYPQSGGTYEYGYELLGPAAGFAAGWMFLVGKLAAAGTVALGCGQYVAAVWPGLPATWVTPGVVLLLTGANLVGINKAGTLNLLLVGLTLTALGVFAVAGIPAVEAANLSPFVRHGWSGVAESSALLFFAYAGYARLATLGEEVRDPGKNIPRAILATLVLSFLVYLAVGLVAVGTVGADALARSPAPLELAAARIGIAGVGGLLALGACTAMSGVLLSQILGLSRMLLAMTRRGDLPAWLGAIDPQRGIPRRAVLLTGAIALGLALVGSIEAVVAAAAFSILLYYAIANAAALRLPPPPRRYPPWIAWVGLAACLAMAGSLRGSTIVAGLGWLAAGFVVRWVVRRS